MVVMIAVAMINVKTIAKAIPTMPEIVSDE